MSLRAITVTCLTAAAIVVVPGVAGAATWEPTQGQNWTPTTFLTAEDPAFWNPLVNENRLSSPYGNRNFIECTSFHGVLGECRQLDRDGNFQYLVRLPANVPNVTGSSAPGGGPGHYVYPFWAAPI